MAKIFSGLAIVSIATLLGGGGFVGYLFASGRLNSARLAQIAAVIRGLPDPVAQPSAEPGPATTRPAARFSAESAEEVAAKRQREHLESLRLERARRDLEAQKRLLDQALQQVVTAQEELVAQRTAIAEERRQRDAAIEDTGFQKELEFFRGLPPKMAKEHLSRVWKKHPIDAVRLFVALEPARGRKILEELKSPQELELMHELLEQVRKQGIEGYARESRTTEGAAAP